MAALKVAVLGSGPAGMYTVEHLLSRPDQSVEIDVFERLPTPWGLIRAGVAPDHPEKKQISERIFHFALKSPGVRFLGNVEIGEDLHHQDLVAHYDAVVYANGDRPLGIPQEQLPGCWPARQFIAWYNGHPDHRHLRFDLTSRRAVVVGTGNVALDIARVLVLPHAALVRTDIADHALSALRASRVEEVPAPARGATTA